MSYHGDFLALFCEFFGVVKLLDLMTALLAFAAMDGYIVGLFSRVNCLINC